MEKRNFIAIGIIAVLFLVVQYIWKKPAETQQQNSVKQASAEVKHTAKETNADDAIQKDISEQSDGLYEASEESEIILENDIVKFVFSNKGAEIKQAFIKNFEDDEKNIVELIPDSFTVARVDLLGDGFKKRLTRKMFQYSQSGQHLSFFLPDSMGNTVVEKSFTLEDNGNLKFNLKINEFPGILGYTFDFGSGINDTEEFYKIKEKYKKREYQFRAQIDKSLQKLPLQKIDKVQSYEGQFDWLAVKSKYFAMAAFPDPKVTIRNVKVYRTNNSPAMKIYVENVNEQLYWDESYDLYFGHLQNELLDNMYGRGAGNIVDLGFKAFRFLSKFFMKVFELLHKVIPNYGMVIIVFALLLKVILYPLSHKSFESTHRMQKVQPLIKEVQQKYKSDPKKMNAELSAIYKENGVNPLGGCLPLLLQMPIFMSLYPMLRSSIELRQTPFVAWLTNLAEPDPYYVLPIIMAVTMFIQQRLMTPPQQDKSKMDEKQQAMVMNQKIMGYAMPALMLWIFHTMPSGLVLYWTVFQVLGIIQQYYIKKKFH